MFLWIEDFARAQTFADRFASLGWIAVLDRYARRVNPLLRDVLAPMQYYWVTTQLVPCCRSRKRVTPILARSALRNSGPSSGVWQRINTGVIVGQPGSWIIAGR